MPNEGLLKVRDHLGKVHVALSHIHFEDCDRRVVRQPHPVRELPAGDTIEFQLACGMVLSGYSQLVVAGGGGGEGKVTCEKCREVFMVLAFEAQVARN